MNELIKITENNGVQTVSGRELHEALGIETKYTTWFDRMCKYGFKENRDYIVCFPNLGSSGRGGQTMIDHIIKLNMAKHICMVQNSPIGTEIRDYFIRMENKAKALAEDEEYILAQGILIADKKIKRLQAENTALNQQIALMQPKAEFFDAVADSKTAIPMGEVAKILDMGIGRNKLFEFLRQKQILMINNQPYQRYIDAGYFRRVLLPYTVPSGEERISTKTLVYPKGIDYIRKQLIQAGYGPNTKEHGIFPMIDDLPEYDFGGLL